MSGENLTTEQLAEIEEKYDPDQLDLYGQQDRDQYFSTGMAIVGMTYMKPINDKSFWRTTISGSVENQNSLHNYFVRHVDAENNYIIDDIYSIMSYNFRQYKYSIASFINGIKSSLSSFMVKCSKFTSSATGEYEY